jgi:hypothetical protein
MVIDHNSILKDPCDLEKYMKKIKAIESHEDQIIQVLKSFLELFPLLDIGLFRYSPFGYLTEGMMAITPEEGLKHIRDMRDDVRTLPFVYKGCRSIANAGNCVVVSAEYRKSPEYKFPIPVEDCYKVLEWVHANAAQLNGDASKIIVGGDMLGEIYRL